MASNVNSSNINGAYPIAGQDNDTQGFRDNFTNIKNNLKAASEEITDLQNKVVLIAPLNGTTTVTNDFSGTTMAGAITAGFTETAYGFLNSPQSGTVVIDFNLGDNQYFDTTNPGPILLDFANWPNPDLYAKVRVLINVTNVAHTITFPAPVLIGTDNLVDFDPVTRILTPPATGKYFFEFSTFDGGTTVIVVPLVVIQTPLI